MLYNALIRTHHITSRKKVSALKRAADMHNCFVLLRSGGCPGIMYVESQDMNSVESWVDVVRNLRYKDFQLVSRPGVVVRDDQTGDSKPSGRSQSSGIPALPNAGLSEVESVKEFGSIMEQRGIFRSQGAQLPIVIGLLSFDERAAWFLRRIFAVISSFRRVVTESPALEAL
ncbi:hypothetical protein CNMCM5793_007970 [Aspergillus hiratsukae]|uniref:Uncharacterized protein n=1 Tax=Aspergillus hiratsukae TaxID=1194566 RepID=A0A8H6PPC7_9EURO|nr:hypothetical protein CNMCM5793_007970 [Aspergillus hiratsukae]KAF7158490.1 hypothetical protein CNMCM6106_005084 [Aspergillus hiratsukae]